MRTLILIAAGLALAGLAGTALAQRDPAYAAARAGGEVGEQPDGYLGLVGAPLQPADSAPVAPPKRP